MSHFTKTSSRTSEAFILSENFLSTVSTTEIFLDLSHFSNTYSITSEAFVLSVDFLSWASSTETWLDLLRQHLFILAHSLLIWLGDFLLTGQELLNSSLLNWKASMPTESLNRNFFLVSECLAESQTLFKQSWFHLSLRQRSHHQSQCQKPTFWIKILEQEWCTVASSKD